MKTKKTIKRRDPYAQEILNRKGPYRPKVINTKPSYPSVADEFDDWYFYNHPSPNRGIHETDDS